MNKEKLIDVMAEAIFRGNGSPNYDWKGCVEQHQNYISGIKGGHEQLCVANYRKLAEVAFQALLQELPMNSDDDPRYYNELLGMRDVD